MFIVVARHNFYLFLTKSIRKRHSDRCINISTTQKHGNNYNAQIYELGVRIN